MEKTFGEVVVFIDCETEGDCACVVPEDFVFFYGRARSVARVFGGAGGGE